MSAGVPVLKPLEVVGALAGLGFVEVRQRGAHKQFRRPDGRGTTVPFHKGRDIAPSLLRKIARDVGLTVEELVRAVPRFGDLTIPTRIDLPHPPLNLP